MRQFATEILQETGLSIDEIVATAKMPKNTVRRLLKGENVPAWKNWHKIRIAFPKEATAVIERKIKKFK